MPTKLIFCDFPSSNTQQALQFYGALLGIPASDFAHNPTDQGESYHYLISPDGIELMVSARRNQGQTVSCFFAVDDLDATLSQLQSAGGTVVVKPAPVQMASAALPTYKSAAHGQQVTGNMGQFAIVRDPDGNTVGMVQLSSEAQHHFQFGHYRRASFTQEQTAGQLASKQLGQHVP